MNYLLTNYWVGITLMFLGIFAIIQGMFLKNSILTDKDKNDLYEEAAITAFFGAALALPSLILALASRICCIGLTQ